MRQCLSAQEEYKIFLFQKGYQRSFFGELKRYCDAGNPNKLLMNLIKNQKGSSNISAIRTKEVKKYVANRRK